MSNIDNFLELGATYEAAFERAQPASMPHETGVAYQEWLAANPDYQPAFGDRLHGALEWAEENPIEFEEMLVDFDCAIAFLNQAERSIDETLFPNIADFWKHRKDQPLPYLRMQVEPEPSKWRVLRAAVNAAHKLRWGETIKSAADDYYNFHSFVKSDRGMVAASMLDLYEDYTKTTGLYPEDSEIDAVLASAITEALYLSRDNGPLFHTLRNPDDQWVIDYDGFSPEFQRKIYERQNLHEVAKLQGVRVREGVELRPLDITDTDQILEVLDTDPGIRDRVSVASDMYTAEDVAKAVEAYRSDPDTLRYAIVEDGKVIGLVSLWRATDLPFDKPDELDDYGFGYFLHPDSRGKGIVVDSVRALMDSAKDQLYVRQFIAFCEDDNPESIAVLSKLGFGKTETKLTEENSGWVEYLYIKPEGNYHYTKK